MKTIQPVIDDIKSLIMQVNGLCATLPDTVMDKRPAEGKWSKKEILGHMCDSAFNNIQRIIRVQYEDRPAIVYNQDAWVKCNNYQERAAQDILLLWTILHRQFIHMLQSFPEKLLGAEIITNEKVTAHFIITDYVRHQRHHLAQLVS